MTAPKPASRLPIRLQPAEQFSPTAFIDPDEGTQLVCNFVLALAVVYNDLKDITWASHHLSEAKSSEFGIEYGGECSGMNVHLQRLALGLFHEMFELIEKGRDTMKHRSFDALISSLNPTVRQQWHDLVGIARSECSKKESTFRNQLGKIRNAAAFHYSDTKPLGRAFISAFSDGRYGAPAVSRGKNLQESRFYFADLAMQFRLSTLAKDSLGSTVEFGEVFVEVSNAVNQTLHSIVERFINQTRNVPWCKYEPPERSTQTQHSKK